MMNHWLLKCRCIEYGALEAIGGITILDHIIKFSHCKKYYVYISWYHTLGRDVSTDLFEKLFRNNFIQMPLYDVQVVAKDPPLLMSQRLNAMYILTKSSRCKTPPSNAMHSFSKDGIYWLYVFIETKHNDIEPLEIHICLEALVNMVLDHLTMSMLANQTSHHGNWFHLRLIEKIDFNGFIVRTFDFVSSLILGEAW